MKSFKNFILCSRQFLLIAALMLMCFFPLHSIWKLTCLLNNSKPITQQSSVCKLVPEIVTSSDKGLLFLHNWHPWELSPVEKWQAKLSFELYPLNIYTDIKSIKQCNIAIMYASREEEFKTALKENGITEYLKEKKDGFPVYRYSTGVQENHSKSPIARQIKEQSEDKRISQVTLSALMLFLSVFSGYCIGILFIPKSSFIRKIIAGTITIWSCLTFLSFLLSFCAVKITLFNASCILFFFSTALFFIRKDALKKKFYSVIHFLKSFHVNKKRKKTPAYLKILGIILIMLMICIVCLVFWVSLTDNEQYWPDYAVWGYKAKMVYNSETLPLSYFNNPSKDFSHLSYPLNWPILLAYSAMGSGSFNIKIMKIIPSFLFLMILLFLYEFFRENFPGKKLFNLLFSFIACGIIVFIQQTYRLYADNLMLLLLLAGFSLLFEEMKNMRNNKKTYSLNRKKNFFAFLLLGMASWTKNEGLLYCMVGGCFFYLLLPLKDKYSFHKTLNFLLISVVPIMIFALPWYLFRIWHKIPTRDFNFFSNQDLWLEDIPYFIKDILSSFYKMLLENSHFSGGIFCLFLFLILFSPKKLLRKKENILLISCVLTIVSTYIICFIFTTMNLTLHLASVGRIIVPPCFLLLICCRNTIDRKSLYNSEN